MNGLRNVFLIFLMIAMGSASVVASRNGFDLEDMKLANFRELKGRFKQTKIIKELGVEINTEGRFHILKPSPGVSVFHWDIEKPRASRICIDGTGIVIDSEGGNPQGKSAKRKDLRFSEVGKEAGDQIANLLKVIIMDEGRIPEDFTVEKKDRHFVLSPKKKEGAFFESVTVEIAKSGLVQNVDIREKSQDEIHLHFMDLKVKHEVIRKDLECIR